MLHIIKSKAGKFNIVSIGTNGNQTARSNEGFHHKAGAIKNIRALIKSLEIPDHETIRIQDNTTALPSICVPIKGWQCCITWSTTKSSARNTVTCSAEIGAINQIQ